MWLEIWCSMYSWPTFQCQLYVWRPEFYEKFGSIKLDYLILISGLPFVVSISSRSDQKNRISIIVCLYRAKWPVYDSMMRPICTDIFCETVGLQFVFRFSIRSRLSREGLSRLGSFKVFPTTERGHLEVIENLVIS